MENFYILDVTGVFASPFEQFRENHIAPAFEELRKHGFHATTKNIQCCQTCSLGVIPDNVSYVFYHAQDVDRFNEMNTLCLVVNRVPNTVIWLGISIFVVSGIYAFRRE